MATEKNDQRYVSRSLNDLIKVHQEIIRIHTTQKARNDAVLKKYQQMVKIEVDRPANRFLEWTNIIIPFVESMITAKSTDFELMKAYKNFLKEVLEYEHQQIISEHDVQRSEENFEIAVSTVLKLENKLIEIKHAAQETVTRLRLEAVERYQSLPLDIQFNDDEHCWLCGAELEPTDYDNEGECIDCTHIPAKLKEPFVRLEKEEVEEEPEPEPEVVEEPKPVEEKPEEYTEEDTSEVIEEQEPEKPKETEQTGEEDIVIKDPKMKKGMIKMAEFLDTLREGYEEDEDGNFVYRSKKRRQSKKLSESENK